MMHARAVEVAATDLHDLRQDERGALALGALAIALSLAATQVAPTLAVPFFVGGIAVGGLGVRAGWRRWALLERLEGERDAFVIDEIRDRAAAAATMERRRILARTVRSWLAEPTSSRTREYAAELEALAAELVDEELSLDPVCAVTCKRLVADPTESPLLNEAFPADELRWRLAAIRAGFAPRARTTGRGTEDE
jgi:hypothetical protein